MRKKIRYYLRKYIWNLPFMITISILGWLIFMTSEVKINYGVDLLRGLQVTYLLSYTTYITPVFVCFPYVMKFHEEKNNKSYQYAILRVGKLKYAAKRVGEAALSGALVMLSAILIYTVLACGYAALHGMPVTLNGGGMLGNEGDDPPGFYYLWIVKGFGFAVYLVNIFVLMLQGAFWTCVGMAVSTFVENKRLAVVSPFLLKKIIIHLITREEIWFLTPINLDFNYWITIQPFGGIPYALAYLAVSIIITITIVYFGMSRFMRK